MSQETSELYAAHMMSLATQARAAISDLDPKVLIYIYHTQSHTHQFVTFNFS